MLKVPTNVVPVLPTVLAITLVPTSGPIRFSEVNVPTDVMAGCALPVTVTAVPAGGRIKANPFHTFSELVEVSNHNSPVTGVTGGEAFALFSNRYKKFSSSNCP